jgi:NTP pyrophosphatase (non-canonical NTP hydrolase)
MTFDEYQKQALKTAVRNPDPDMDKTIWAMGIAGEAGEVVEKWKKIMAYDKGVVSKDRLNELAKEMADVVWYIAVFADSLGLSFESIMKQNLEKLKDREERNVIKGRGDNR